MKKQEFKDKISIKRKRLLEDNKKAEVIGDKHKILCNCNQLKGIDFVMQQFKRIK